MKETASRDDDLARGFGDEIQWRSYDEGLKEAAERDKPVMLIIHKSWCGACKALKPKFAASKEIREMSRYFVMINVQDDEEPKDDAYKPDGGYIPRIFFLESMGTVREDIQNARGNPSYKYYYPEPAHIAESMKRAVEAIKSPAAAGAGDEL